MDPIGRGIRPFEPARLPRERAEWVRLVGSEATTGASVRPKFERDDRAQRDPSRPLRSAVPPIALQGTRASCYTNIDGLISSATSEMLSTGSPASSACRSTASSFGASYSQ